jgi:hypothetical protein
MYPSLVYGEMIKRGQKEPSAGSIHVQWKELNN